MEKIREQLRVRKEKAILVAVIRIGDSSYNGDLDELRALANTAGAIIVETVKQKIRKINPATYIGKGKAEVLAQRAKNNDADVVIFDNELSPAQIRELEKIIQIKVVDRSELILDIFATRAQTKQAKLQVELAQLEYIYPRLTRMWSHLDTVTGAATAAGAVGGIGTRGTGEKQLEIDRRIVSKRIVELKRELKGIDKRRRREVESRKDIFKVCIVGYTNAGKSTLMNALTDAGVFVENRLFATLDTRTRKWSPAGGRQVLLSDTVGFVRNLPHQLIESFKATLEEAVEADLLLHVVDVSSEDAHRQIKSVEGVLAEIGCAEKPSIMLLNKADIISGQKQLETLKAIYPEAICVSAKFGLALEQLREAVVEVSKGEDIFIRVRNGVADGRVRGFLCANGKILSEEYTDSTVVIDARLGRRYLGGLKRLNPQALEIIKN